MNLICKKCGTKVEKINARWENTIKKGYKYYCPKCDSDLFSSEVEKESEWIECDYCHEEFIKDDVKKDEDGKWICCGCNKDFQKVKDFNF